jgi:hypothetical protein
VTTASENPGAFAISAGTGLRSIRHRTRKPPTSRGQPRGQAADTERLEGTIAKARASAEAEGWPHAEADLLEAAETALVNGTDPSAELFGIL